MEFNIILCILGVVLLVQRSPAYSGESSEETIVEGTPRERLFTNIIEFFEDFAEVLIADTEFVFNHYIDWDKVTPDNATYIDELAAYIKREEQLRNRVGKNKSKEMFLMVKQILKLLEKYTSDDDENVEASLKHIKNTLRNPFKYVEIKYLIHFAKWKEFVKENLKAYIESLTATQKIEETKLIEWYEKMQKETNLEKKIGLYAIFFDIEDIDK